MKAQVLHKITQQQLSTKIHKKYVDGESLLLNTTILKNYLPSTNIHHHRSISSVITENTLSQMHCTLISHLKLIYLTWPHYTSTMRLLRETARNQLTALHTIKLRVLTQ